MPESGCTKLNENKMEYVISNAQNSKNNNPVNPQIWKIMIQTISAEILNSILKLPGLNMGLPDKSPEEGDYRSVRITDADDNVAFIC